MSGLVVSGPGVAQAEDTARVVELSVEGATPRVVILEPSDAGLLIDPSELPVSLFAPEALAEIPSVDVPSCQACLPIRALGTYEEDTQAGTATLRLDPALRPEQDFSVGGARRSAAAEHLQRQFGIIGSISLTGRRTETDGVLGETTSDGYAGALRGGISLGRAGVLRSGIRVSQTPTDEVIDTRLPTFLENHWIDGRVTLELGETRAIAEPNEGGPRILGLRVRRNFLTRPDLLYQPLLDFYTLLDRPSVVELFLDTERVRREQVTQSGPVRISNYQPSRPGRVVVLVTDAAGTRRVLETSFFFDSRNLGRGVWDFDVSAGAIQTDTGGVRDAQAAAARVGVGLTRNITVFGFAQGLRDRFLDDAQSEAHAIQWLSGLTGVAGTPIGKFDISAIRSVTPDDETGTRYVANWQVGGQNRYFGYTLGATAFREDNYVDVQERDSDNLRGGRVFAGLGRRRFSISGSYFDLNERRGATVNLGWRFSRQFGMSIGVQQPDGFDPVYTALLRWSPSRGRQNAALGSRLDTNSQVGSAVGTYSAAALDNRVFLTARHEEPYSDRREGNELPDQAEVDQRTTASLSWRSGIGPLRYGIRRFDDTLEHTLDASTSFLLSRHGTFRLIEPVGQTTGIAVVDIGIPDVDVSVNGRTHRTNWRGIATVPVRGFGRQTATIDAATLPPNTVLDRYAFDVSTVPGQGATASTSLGVPAAFIEIAGAAPGDRVVVNGEVAVVYDFGVFAENLVLGTNSVRHDGTTYTLQIDEPDATLPVYQLSGGDK